MLRQMALPTNKLTYTLSLIENQYVDSVAMDSLAEHVIPLLVKELDQRTARRRIRRHRRGLQHGDRHGDRAERHPAGPKRQGRDQGRRPYHRDQRHARRGAENPAARRGEETARPARHDRTPRAGTPGYLRPGGRRRRSRQDSDQKRRIGVLHCRRHRLHQAGTVRTDDLRRDAGIAGHVACAGRHQTYLRPEGQLGRLPRPGHHGRQRIPAQRPADRLHGRPPAQTAARIRRRHGRRAGYGRSGADRRGQRVVERDPRRGIAG